MAVPKAVYKFFYWFFVFAPSRLFRTWGRILILVNNGTSLALNIRMFFVPLFHDFTWIGRGMGFVYRLLRIVLGTFVFFFMFLLGLVINLAWFLLPIFILLYESMESTWLLGYVLLLLLAWKVFYLSSPWKRVGKVGEKEILECFQRPAAVFINRLKGNREEALNFLFQDKNIKKLLKKLELEDTTFIQEIINSNAFESSKVAKAAYDYANEQKTRFVEIEHIFLALLVYIDKYEKFLDRFGLDFETCKKAARWVVSWREYLAKMFFWQVDYEVPVIGGIDRAMTGRTTPVLDSISTDFTGLAQEGFVAPVFGHKEVQQQVVDLIGSSSNTNVLIVGPPGSGKTSLVKGIALKIVKGTKEGYLQFKRIVSVESSGLIAGAKSAGEISEKINRIMDEVRGSKGVILFFDEIHNLILADAEGSSTIFALLEPHIAAGNIQVIGATNLENYRKYIEPNGAFSRLFQKVDIGPTSDEETLEILENTALKLGQDSNVEISFIALKKIIELTKKLVQERVFPDKAIDVLGRVVARVSKSTRYVTGEEVAKTISTLTNVPVTSITQTEADKLLNIEKQLKESVIGQDEALIQVSKALKRGRVGIRSESKPIASFLFVGTTGVGKTETAKTLARVYFGDEKAMIRLDMSEYQQPDSINRLIDRLTSQVRSKPFSIILLDEVEKAYSEILLAFLQVLDDGRLTDSSGRVVDFTSTMIIATSNIGTRSLQAVSERGGSLEEMQKVATKDVRDFFAPEFLNRFTGIIVYKPLSNESVRKISLLMLEKVKRRVDERGIKVLFKQDLVDELVKRGFSAEWGARPLARVIEDSVETYIAEKILAKEISGGDELELGLEIFQQKD